MLPADPFARLEERAARLGAILECGASGYTLRSGASCRHFGDLEAVADALATTAQPDGDAFSRETRVRLIGEAAQDLLADRMPDREARIFLAGALLAWLESGGNLERDYFRTVRPKSHSTASAIWQRIRHRDEDATR